MAKPFVKYWYYCEVCECADTHDFVGSTKTEAKNNAESKGWKIGKLAKCPNCIEVEALKEQLK